MQSHPQRDQRRAVTRVFRLRIHANHKARGNSFTSANHKPRRGLVERVACHVAFQDPGLGGSAGRGRRVRPRRDCWPARGPASRSASTSVQIAALSWQAERHVSFTSDPSARDRAGPDLRQRRSRRLRRHRRRRHAPKPAPARANRRRNWSRSPRSRRQSDPVIYLSHGRPGRLPHLRAVRRAFRRAMPPP